MNALDRLISVFAPEAAYRRAQYRAAMQVTLAYDGAKSGRRTDGWVSGSGDVNTEVGAALIALRNRSRDLLGNNPYASKAVNELVSNTVGTGIKPQSMYPTLVVKEKLQAPWSLWANEANAAGVTDIYSLQALAFRSMERCGPSHQPHQVPPILPLVFSTSRGSKIVFRNSS